MWYNQVSKFLSSYPCPNESSLPLLGRCSLKLCGLFKNKPIGPREFDMCVEERSGKWCRKEGKILPKDIDGKKERNGGDRGGGGAGGAERRQRARIELSIEPRILP